ncbi:MAG: glycerate-2-kinase family protein, partial [Polyangiales bacterium]
MLSRAFGEVVFAEAVAACDPAARVLAALADVPAGDRRLGIAIGKAALAMARGAGPVAHGVAIAPADDGAALPAGWRVILAPHPAPDQRSVDAGEAAWRIADREARAGDVVLVLISGGASALVEAPRDGVTLDVLRTTVAALMAAGAPIAELNVVRSALSRIKAGGLIAHCPTRVVTLAISDVIGDDLATIGSGPTIAPAAPLSSRAVDVLRRHGIAVPPVLAAPEPVRSPRIGDVARVIAPMTAFADGAIASLAARGIQATRLDPPIAGDVHAVATEL